MWIITRLNDSPLNDLHLHETAIFYYCILAVLLGAQLLVAGLLAELIVSRTADAHRPYSIAQRIGESPAPASPSPAVSDHAQD
jgi:dolichol-phosphate mannosyltransferase